MRRPPASTPSKLKCDNVVTLGVVALSMRRLLERYRLPENSLEAVCGRDLPEQQGFWKLAGNIICFGSCSAGPVSSSCNASLYELQGDVCANGELQLPFDPDQLVENLLLERYPLEGARPDVPRLARSAYYALRTFLPGGARRQLQRMYLAGWQHIQFPRWPVDCTVEEIFRQVLALAMRAQGIEELPFIWFWPGGHDAAAMVTHDVEGAAGKAFCSALMDLDDSCEIKSAFQIIPERRYPVEAQFLAGFRDRGFEVNVHDLNHDGSLFLDEREFRRRADAINRYGRQFGAAGFRAGAMYRNQRWYQALDFEFDMTVPNVAHLEPQRGGCCTVFPYFIGKVLELPLTTAQDYSLFLLMRDSALEVWRRQIELIRRQHGLISILVHPDYITENWAQQIYLRLLRQLAQLRAEGNLWIAKPAEVNAWWRLRSKLRLVRCGGEWKIEGEGSGRACIAFACLDRGEIVYRRNPMDCSPKSGRERKAGIRE